MRSSLIIFFAIIILGFYNYSIYEKERILANGDTVYIELAPVDPRSLIQGDYMRLAYQMEHAQIPKEKKRFKKIVITMDENQIAQFVRFHQAGKLKKGEKTLLVQQVGQEHLIQPRSFFFQEGLRKPFEQAKYGILKFDKNNNYILIGLADKKQKEIKPD